MKTVKTTFIDLTNYHNIMAGLRELLFEVDPEFRQEETLYQEAVTHMLAVIPPERKTLAQDLLEKQEAAIAGHMIFLVWKGLMQNLKCFQDPLAKRFLELDYEDIHQESIMQGMPMSQQYWSAADAFHQSLSEEDHSLFDAISSYYCYLDTVANKIAHYYGFLLGNRLLPHLIPGYEADISITIQYGWMIEKYLNMRLHQIEE